MSNRSSKVRVITFTPMRQTSSIVTSVTHVHRLTPPEEHNDCMTSSRVSVRPLRMHAEWTARVRPMTALKSQTAGRRLPPPDSRSTLRPLFAEKLGLFVNFYIHCHLAVIAEPRIFLLSCLNCGSDLVRDVIRHDMYTSRSPIGRNAIFYQGDI